MISDIVFNDSVGGSGRSDWDTELQSWWAEVRSWSSEVYEAGRVLRLFNIRALSMLRGADERLAGLYVRRDFDSLYKEICFNQRRNWLCHLNGNSGVGKSAFLWYFIIRKGIDTAAGNRRLHILYQSGDHMWEFKDGTATVAIIGSYASSSFRQAQWHLINQKVPETGFLGRIVLVAASPEKGNIKAAKAERAITPMYMYPWEKDEYEQLVKLWEGNVSSLIHQQMTANLRLEALVKRMHLTLSPEPVSTKSINDVNVDELLARADQPLDRDAALCLAIELQMVVTTMKDEVLDLSARLAASDIYYRWFGGAVRLLWTADRVSLNEAGFTKQVNEALNNSDLHQVILQSKDISCMLLQFKKRPADNSCKQYQLDFCSSKVKSLFLSRMKTHDLQTFVRTAAEIPEYGSLRGFVFEQLAVAEVLYKRFVMAAMVDDRHCNKCNCREDKGSKSVIHWVQCDCCENWYHCKCVNLVAAGPWQCGSCGGRKGDTVVEPERELLLQYYEGSLESALMDAGAAASKYVWRPVIKNNAAFDFVVLPNILGQPTVGKSHPVPAEAVKNGVAALNTWNLKYGGGKKESVLCFFLAEDNFDGFGFQSYRDKSRRVSAQAVKGIRQCKVRLLSGMPLQYGHIGGRDNVEVVDDISDLKFEGELCPTNRFDPDEEIERWDEKLRMRSRGLVFDPVTVLTE